MSKKERITIPYSGLQKSRIIPVLVIIGTFVFLCFLMLFELLNDTNVTDKDNTTVINMTSEKIQDATIPKGVDFEPYMNELQRQIKSNWKPPYGTKTKRAVLLFKIAKDGKLLSCDIENSSGNQKFDNAAINAVKRTAPFRPLPNEYNENSVDINFTFDYNREDRENSSKISNELFFVEKSIKIQQDYVEGTFKQYNHSNDKQDGKIYAYKTIWTGAYCDIKLQGGVKKLEYPIYKYYDSDGNLLSEDNIHEAWAENYPDGHLGVTHPEDVENGKIYFKTLCKYFK